MFHHHTLGVLTPAVADAVKRAAELIREVFNFETSMR